MGNMEGVVFKDCSRYDGVTTYDLVWFVTPEFPQPSKRLTKDQHRAQMRQMIGQMQPKVLMYMVHNGHMKNDDWEKIKSLASPDVPVLTLAPHVAASIGDRGLPLPPDWILPIFPFDPPNPCTLADLKAGRQCIRGFSVQGRIEKSRRNYTHVWEQIGGHKRRASKMSVANFRLNILGETVEAFSVPADVRDLVAVYKNPPYPIFYDVVHHSFALVPMLASGLYYKSKFSSTVLTSLITGVPIIADERMLQAYSFLERKAVFYQDDSQTELDVMFAVSKMKPDDMWRARSGVAELRRRMNERAKKMITGWLEAKGVAVEPEEARRLLLQRRRDVLAVPEGPAAGALVAEGPGSVREGAGREGAQVWPQVLGPRGDPGSGNVGPSAQRQPQQAGDAASKPQAFDMHTLHDEVK
ncbi:hypothetical protein MNEG_3957 [Monoraphidium neglectum]|uniref:Glycosyltransferase n=1 Tax=Monoraphidium neglectum TaxID=145388 RepID=A0A0D2JZS9_9CHLO|nr:hypothetical protein MNEG_3957 [Monoraphidium neglectum]KIZ04003.1 hypothetical protein MNEG_3957 [Monoraphidium neglectum]|eukprot:XP_013903022.1 hypothetical protein MNEG_3957 [Monoraphidium neglectum]